MIIVLSLSGGKDSVALWLYLLRNGVTVLAVYADTGWECEPEHGQYLTLLERLVGPIVRIRPEMDFEQMVRLKGQFPSRVRKWCTEQLKLVPFAAFLDRLRKKTGDEVTVAIGVRAEESPSRAAAPMREKHDLYDCDVVRPILHWKLNRVIAEHHRADVPMHPLYFEGAERVGCFPCVNAPKSELAMVARLKPERVAKIRELEAETGTTMFTRDRRAEKKRLGDHGPSVVPVGIDEVIAWANTDRGGKQMALVRLPTGCAKWGNCEVPTPKPEAA